MRLSDARIERGLPKPLPTSQVRFRPRALTQAMRTTPAVQSHEGLPRVSRLRARFRTTCAGSSPTPRRGWDFTSPPAQVVPRRALTRWVAVASFAPADAFALIAGHSQLSEVHALRLAHPADPGAARSSAVKGGIPANAAGGTRKHRPTRLEPVDTRSRTGPQRGRWLGQRGLPGPRAEKQRCSDTATFPRPAEARCESVVAWSTRFGPPATSSRMRIQPDSTWRIARTA